jgi:hypothetical protein
MSELYAIVCRDKADTKPVRMAGLKEHLSHLDEVFDRVSLACPLHGEDGGFAGSLLVISATDKADAEAFIAADPYYKAGIWESVEISRLGVKAGSWVGGKPW